MLRGSHASPFCSSSPYISKRKQEMGVLTRAKKQGKGVSRRQNAVLKVLHPRGYVIVFHEPVTAGEIMDRYPRHCIARPDFFEYPWIVVRPESVLVPGKVFYLVPYHTIDSLLKAKRKQLESLNFSSTNHQSAKHYNHRLNHNRQNSAIKSLAGVTPRSQQQDRYYRRQPHHHDNNIINDQESYGNDGTQGQDSDNGSLYKVSFYKSWNRMRRALQQPHQESHLQVDSGLASLLDTSRSFFGLRRSSRPHVASPEQIEFRRLKSCLRKADSDRKKLNLKVSFASPVVIPGCRRGSPSVQQHDLVLKFDHIDYITALLDGEL